MEGSRDLADEVFTNGYLAAMASDARFANVRNISSTRMTLDRWPGAMVEFYGDQERVGIEVTSFNRTYVALYGRYLIVLQLGVYTRATEADPSFERTVFTHVQLFGQIANSLVIQSQY